MTDYGALYEKQINRVRTAKLFARFSAIFAFGVIFPAIAAVMIALSAVFTVFFYFFAGAAALLSLGVLLFIPGFRDMFSHFGDTMLMTEQMATAIGHAYYILMPIFAVGAVVFGTLAIVTGLKIKREGGSSGIMVRGIVALVFAAAGVIAYICLMAGGTL